MADTRAEPQSDQQTKTVGGEANQPGVGAHVGQRQVAIPLPSLGRPSGPTSTRVHYWYVSR